MTISSLKATDFCLYVNDYVTFTAAISTQYITIQISPNINKLDINSKYTLTLCIIKFKHLKTLNRKSIGKLQRGVRNEDNDK